MKVTNYQKRSKTSERNVFDLSEPEQKIINWLRRKKQCTLEEVYPEIIDDKMIAKDLLTSLEQKSFLQAIEIKGNLVYQLYFSSPKQEKFIEKLLKNIETKIGKIQLANLIILIFISTILLIPFVLSPIYLPILRENNFDLYQLFQGDLYKQITGYISLFFVFLEMILTARKRGKGWLVKISIPGSLFLWRSLHIFVGVGLLGIILIHTTGSTGLNFNAIFLWVFFGVTLSALVGATAEMGVLESPRKSFGGNPQKSDFINQILPTYPKAKLIRTLRDIWLSTHIFLVNVFFIMLVFHIFLAYYYQ